VADAIVSARRNYNDRPLEDQRMKSVTVDNFGVDYPEPETV
jgi:peptidyl-prolyl cis-trans isomerase B (cyclophilin B)